MPRGDLPGLLRRGSVLPRARRLPLPDGEPSPVTVDEDGTLYSEWLGDYPPSRLATTLRADGYQTVWLPGVGQMQVHVAVCIAWHGPKPSPDHQVDHIDRNRHNNRPENLRWVTPEENAENRENPAGPEHASSVLSAREVRAIRSLSENGVSLRVLGAAFECSKDTVRRVVKRITYQNVV